MFRSHFNPDSEHSNYQNQQAEGEQVLLGSLTIPAACGKFAAEIFQYEGSFQFALEVGLLVGLLVVASDYMVSVFMYS